MRFVAGSIGLLLVLLSGPVSAGEVKVGNVALQLSPPPGYCDLDQSFAYDKSLSANNTKIVEGAGNSPFAYFPDCQELKKARQAKGAAFIGTKVSVQGHNLGSSGQGSVQSTCDELRAIKVSDQLKDMQDNVKKNSGGVTLVDQSGLGVLDEVKGEVCYYGLVQNNSVNGKAAQLLTIIIVAMRQRSLFFIYDGRPLDSTSLAAMLTHAKSVYADFAKANPN